MNLSIPVIADRFFKLASFSLCLCQTLIQNFDAIESTNVRTKINPLAETINLILRVVKAKVQSVTPCKLRGKHVSVHAFNCYSSVSPMSWDDFANVNKEMCFPAGIESFGRYYRGYSETESAS